MGAVPRSSELAVPKLNVVAFGNEYYSPNRLYIPPLSIFAIFFTKSLATFGANMKSIFLFIIIACTVACFSNCNKTSSAPSSVLSIYNIDPAVKPQDMYLNGLPTARNITYGFDTNNVPIFPGTYNIKFAPSPTTNFNKGYNIDFSVGKNYSMFLLNVNGALQPEVFDENIQPLG